MIFGDLLHHTIDVRWGKGGDAVPQDCCIPPLQQHTQASPQVVVNTKGNANTGFGNSESLLLKLPKCPLPTAQVPTGSTSILTIQMSIVAAPMVKEACQNQYIKITLPG